MIFYSIRTKILFLGLVFAGLIGTAFFIYSMRTTVNFKNLRLEVIEKTVDYETEKVNKIITEIEHSTIFYSFSGRILLNTQAEDLIEKLAIEYIRNNPVLSGGGFWFEPYAFRKDKLKAGFFAYRDKDSGNVQIADNQIMEGYDYHDKAWYKELFENITEPNKIFWTRPYLDYTEKFSIMTTAGVGIFDDYGNLIALTTADWEIDEVVKELIAIKPTENSFVLLCVPDKDYVISSTRTNAVTGASISEIPWDITADVFHFNGIDYKRFGKYMENGWLLSIQIPENEIFAEIEKRNESFTIAIGIVSIIMLLIAWYLISILINRPIKQLTWEVSQIAYGDFDRQIKVNSKDELGIFANVFNKMTSDIKRNIEEKTKERLEKDKINAELNIAASIQASMLPCVFPPFPERNEFELYASMIPAKEVCGDFYDFFMIEKDILVILIADVSGNGIPAALFMVIAKTLIKNCSSCRSPLSVFDSVNKKLCEGNDTGMFVTAFIGFYHIPTGKFTYVNAGHNPPLIQKNGLSFNFLNTIPCIVLGFLNNTKYHEEVVYLEPGDSIFLYTDGVTEAMNKTKELFGEKRLLAAANKQTFLIPKELITSVKKDVDDFSSGAKQNDDITMLVLQIKEVKNLSTELKEMIISAEAENLERVIKFVNNELVELSCPNGINNEICIAVEEIYMNIVNYAYEKSNGDVYIGITKSIILKQPEGKDTKDEFSEITIRFEDTGYQYNPLEKSDPDFGSSIADREIGGLGVFMVKNLMDSLDYSYIDGKNILILKKNYKNK